MLLHAVLSCWACWRRAALCCAVVLCALVLCAVCCVLGQLLRCRAVRVWWRACTLKLACWACWSCLGLRYVLVLCAELDAALSGCELAEVVCPAFFVQSVCFAALCCCVLLPRCAVLLHAVLLSACCEGRSVRSCFSCAAMPGTCPLPDGRKQSSAACLPHAPQHVCLATGDSGAAGAHVCEAPDAGRAGEPDRAPAA